MIVKFFNWLAEYNYKSEYIKAKRLHDTYVLWNNDMKFEMVQSIFTHINFTFNWKFLSSQDPNQMAEMAVKHALTCWLKLWIHTINMKLESNVPMIYITTVTFKQQKLSNVVNIKYKIYQQAFNVTSNMNTYRFLAIHQCINPIQVYITPMCMSLWTKILFLAMILALLTVYVDDYYRKLLNMLLILLPSYYICCCLCCKETTKCWPKCIWFQSSNLKTEVARR